LGHALKAIDWILIAILSYRSSPAHPAD